MRNTHWSPDNSNASANNHYIEFKADSEEVNALTAYDSTGEGTHLMWSYLLLD